MHLQSKLQVDYTIDKVTNFFYEPSSLEKWDRSVAQMIPASASGTAVGSTFDTIAPSGMKMNYEIIEFDSERSVKIQLNNSKMFKRAVRHFEFDPIGTGTVITCHVYFTLRLPYIFLYPVLYFNKQALSRDLGFFKTALEENYQTKTTY